MIQSSSDAFRIEIADQQSRALDKHSVAEVVRMILSDAGIVSAEISIAMVDSSEMRELNCKYLNHDYDTDVLSFVLEESDDFLAGQLIISTDYAASKGEELGIPMEHELLLYAIHGTLHLIGYDDLDDETAGEMREAEAEYLGRLGIRHFWED